MKKLLVFLVISSLSLINNLGYAQPTDDSSPQLQQTTPIQTADATQAVEKISIVNTKMAMRKLWEDHIVWTRNFIISALAGLKDIDAVTNRLLRNQDDIGTAIKPYYGDDAGNKLTKLLREHILIAAKVVKAAKANNKTALDKAQKEWAQNADEIATFLSGANPNWNKADLLAALQMHLDLTTKETSARLHKNWDDDIKAYDANHDHMLMFSDTLVEGIAKQFPEKFSA